jgi:hypothetical protein
MSRYRPGYEPRCPTQSPQCAGVLYRRESRECAPCRAWRGKAKDEIGLNLQPTERVEYVGDKCHITRPTHEVVRTLEDLIRVCEIDTETWRVERWTANKWEMGSVDAKKQPHTTPLFQIKAVLVRRVELIAAREEVDNLIQFAKAHIMPRRSPWPVYEGPDAAPLMLEINISDLHAGKLAWGKETGGANYNSKIAVGLYEDALEILLTRVGSGPWDHILLVMGNDFLNADNVAGTTTQGTQVSSDSRFHKTFGLVREMSIRAIERLRVFAPVVVLLVPGNHDQLTVWHLGDSLDCYFHKCIDVTICNDPTQRKYHQFGKVMLMFTHGNKGKHADYPLLMATEQPMMFGSTTHREAHIGHRHESKLQEFHGVRVRTISALCSADEWHAANQFVGNARSAEAFVWHHTEGLISAATYTVTGEQAA